MLILTRQEGEKIYIGDKIIVEVTRYNNERVRLGIDAPPEKIVLRGELHSGLIKPDTEIVAVDTLPDSIVPLARCG